MALSHSQKIETSIEDNWPDAADSPRALRAQVRALRGELAELQADRDALWDKLYLPGGEVSLMRQRLQDLEQEVLSVAA